MNLRFVLIAVLGLATLCGCGQSDPSLLMQRKWQQLCEDGGDLAGAQHWSEDGLSEDSVLTTTGWQTFLQTPPDKLVPFLMTRLASTNEIAVEAGLWGRTTEGAMAVYAIQQVLHVDWTQSPPSYVLLNKYKAIVSEEDRNAVPFLLMDIAARGELTQFFQRSFDARMSTGMKRLSPAEEEEE